MMWQQQWPKINLFHFSENVFSSHFQLFLCRLMRQKMKIVVKIIR